MGDKEDYLTSYREFFENFAATVNPEDQLPVNIAGYTITEAELPGEVLYWTTQYLAEKSCPLTLMTPLRRIILDEVRIASKKQPHDFGYKPDESVYIALRLMQAVTARVNDVCLRYLDNSRLDTLPPPPPQKELKTVSIATKNSRRVMEDRHIEIGNLEALFGIETTEPTSFYAVYDGHAGSAAATYCAAHLHQYLVESPHFRTDLRKALRDAFLRTDQDFVRKSNQERANGGSTAVAVAVRGRKLLCAWAGDSLALLAKRMRLMQLVRPHKPGRQDERDRIEQQGGTVMYWGTWRVNGQLAVSRAIGDAQYKPYVTARPETATVDLDGDEDFVVVACDGLWDFVSEDDVALSIYRQIAADPDDLKAVTKRLVLQAKRQGSADNISIIVVFLKEPREIAADNCPPMDLGLDNALANAPPFVMDNEACKRVDGAGAEPEADCEPEADNGIDNSDSDSEDLGPETAVDVDLDVDDFEADTRHNEQPPTPPAHAVEQNHVDGSLVDNVAESGEESEDEWNYFKGEGEGQDQPRAHTPQQDNSAWETSSTDMNSSPLNPDAPVFVPTGVSDVVLAESPRKPLPMDDIELPAEAQFSTEAHVRPAELLDLDNCDQLNGHHNNEASKEHINGNEKSTLDSLGFGFESDPVGDKADSGLIHDFERIQKDTTDFCNIQVFQAHTETNPFAAGDDNDELLERLKNKERDPMSMSFYQEKDDDTCERLMPEKVDLNAVQPLPDSDDEEQQNGHVESDKENINPDTGDLLGEVSEPSNDILRFNDRSDAILDNAANFARTENIFDPPTNMQTFAMEFDSENREDVAHTETPESHKLLFEQIPEIPDGKNSELGFAAEDPLDPSERVITPHEETLQDVNMDNKPDESTLEQQEIAPEAEIGFAQDSANEILSEFESQLKLEDSPAPSPAPVVDTPEQHDVQQNIIADVHQESEPQDDFPEDKIDIRNDEVPEIKFESQSAPVAASPLPAQSPLPSESPAPVLMDTTLSPLPAESPVPAQSPIPAESPVPAQSPLPVESPVPAQSPFQSEPQELAPSPVPTQELAPSPVPSQELAPSPVPSQELAQSPMPSQELAPSPVPSQEFAPSPVPSQELAPSPVPSQELAPSPVPSQELAPSPVPSQELAPSPVPSQELAPSPVPSQEIAPSPVPSQELAPSPVPSQELAPSPVPIEEPAPSPADVPLPCDSPTPDALRPDTASPVTASPLPVAEPAVETLSAVSELQARLSPEPGTPEPAAEEPVQEPSGPTPDIVPEQSRSDLVTDIDIGIPELRAQEICVPVTSEIREETEQATATPPPTPAVDLTAPPEIPPVSDTLIAADAPQAEKADDKTTVAVAAAATAVAATAATAAAISKTKTPTSAAKKSPTTPKPAPSKATPKAAAARTPISAKKPAAATPPAKAPVTKTTPARTPLSATKPAAAKTPVSAAPKTPLSAPKPAAPKPAPARTSTGAPKPAAVPKAAAPKSAAAPKAGAAAAKPAAKEPAKAAAPRPATATAARPAPKPAAAPRPATAGAGTKPAAPAARPFTARPAPTTRPAAPRVGSAPAARPKPLEKKPLNNGDVKPGDVKKPPTTARPAPRPTPRAPASAPAKPAAAAPRPAPRATAPRPAPTDKHMKELANKRSAAKAAPPKPQLPPGTKPPPIKAPKKIVPAEPEKKEPATNGPANGLTNGSADGDFVKPPPSPPPADNALLPDVIA